MATPPAAQRRAIEMIEAQLADGRDRRFGLLHIPKTGGTSLRAALDKAQAQGVPVPLVFPHNLSVALAVRAFPDTRHVFLLRDPLERAISGFQSRLRSGRPQFDIPWTAEEAAAFAHFPSVEHWLDAMLRDDDFSYSAVRFAGRAVKHLGWNYVHFFGDAEQVAQRAGRFALIGRTGDMAQFCAALAGLCGFDPDLLPAEHLHVSQRGPASILARYTPEDQARLRARFEAEYRIVAALEALPSFLR